MTSHTLRIQKVLETANIKLSSVLANVLGKSGRAILDAIVAGVEDPRKLAAMVDHRVKAKPEQIVEALKGRVTEHHRFLIRVHLTQVDPSLNKQCAMWRRDWAMRSSPFERS